MNITLIQNKIDVHDAQLGQIYEVPKAFGKSMLDDQANKKEK